MTKKKVPPVPLKPTSNHEKKRKNNVMGLNLFCHTPWTPLQAVTFLSEVSSSPPPLHLSGLQREAAVG